METGEAMPLAFPNEKGAKIGLGAKETGGIEKELGF